MKQFLAIFLLVFGFFVFDLSLKINPIFRPVVQAQSNIQACQTDNDCNVSEFCYQPPMPECPEGMDCVQVMPPKECRPDTCSLDSNSIIRCPLFSDPAPGFCANGEIVAQPVDDCGCQRPPLCRYQIGDINQDGVVDIRDYTILSNNFFQADFEPATDLNNDGKVDLLDYTILSNHFSL